MFRPGCQSRVPIHPHPISFTLCQGFNHPNKAPRCARGWHALTHQGKCSSLKFYSLLLCTYHVSAHGWPYWFLLNSLLLRCPPWSRFRWCYHGFSFMVIYWKPSRIPLTSANPIVRVFSAAKALPLCRKTLNAHAPAGDWPIRGMFSFTLDVFVNTSTCLKGSLIGLPCRAPISMNPGHWLIEGIRPNEALCFGAVYSSNPKCATNLYQRAEEVGWNSWKRSKSLPFWEKIS